MCLEIILIMCIPYMVLVGKRYINHRINTYFI